MTQKSMKDQQLPLATGDVELSKAIKNSSVSLYIHIFMALKVNSQNAI